eukprot:TRINITY_DN1719_c0_g1_i5.p1 TRINITY_DN1719_c0_g1~~TRINITY_DN1719_c0_g1_i5.p1  ORF type:complete len:509 (+),score=54.82 TRINITY_DN1719_c0_g1_i5:3473-4999(+)
MTLHTAVLCLLSLCAICVYQALWKPIFSRLRAFPRPPRPSFLKGHAERFILDRNLDSVLEYAKSCSFRPFCFDFWWFPVLWLPDAEAIATVMASAEIFTKKNAVAYEILGLVLKNGLLTETDRSQHAIARKGLASSFSSKSIRAMTVTFDEQASICVDRWTLTVRSRSTAVQIPIFRDLAHTTLDALGKTVFGTALSCQTSHADDAVSACTLLGQSMFNMARKFEMLADRTFWVVVPGWRSMPWVSTVRLANKINAFWDKLAYAAIATKRDDNKSKMMHGPESAHSIIDTLTRFEPALEDTVIRDHMLTFLFAGHETTGTAISWVMYLLAQHQEKQALLQEELDTVFGPYAGEHIHPDVAQLEQCRYLNACINETLRMKPPIPYWSRRATCDVQLDGKLVPKDSIVIISPLLVHYNPHYWDEPEVFRPERWFKDDVIKHPCQFLPFSRGSRNCIGMKFAETEMRIILAKTLHRFRFQLPDQLIFRDQCLVTLRTEPLLELCLSERVPT